MMSRRSLMALVPFLVLGAARTVEACAVPTSVRVENRATAGVRSLFVSSPATTDANPRFGLPAGQTVTTALPKGGLAPGETATIRLPSCLGLYDIAVVFADGRQTAYPSLNAQTIRELILR